MFVGHVLEPFGVVVTSSPVFASSWSFILICCFCWFSHPQFPLVLDCFRCFGMWTRDGASQIDLFVYPPHELVWYNVIYYIHMYVRVYTNVWYTASPTVKYYEILAKQNSFALLGRTNLISHHIPQKYPHENCWQPYFWYLLSDPQPWHSEIPPTSLIEVCENSRSMLDFPAMLTKRVPPHRDQGLHLRLRFVDLLL